jgi:hypothetical protein
MSIVENLKRQGVFLADEHERNLRGGMEYREIGQDKEGFFPSPPGKGWELVFINHKEKVACHQRKIPEVRLKVI